MSRVNKRLRRVVIKLDQVQFYLYRGEKGTVAKAANVEMTPSELNYIRSCVRREIVRRIAAVKKMPQPFV
jgi:hypothetical protein